MAAVRKKVETTIHFLNLDCERVVQARKQKWREVSECIEEFHRACPADPEDCSQLDFEEVERVAGRISELTDPSAPYAATARACLEANGVASPVPRPEEGNMAA